MVSLGKEACLGHARLGHIAIYTRLFYSLLQLYGCELVVQLGVGIGCEVAVVAVEAPGAPITKL